MKKFFLILGIILFALFLKSAQAEIVSCNFTGYEVNTFYTNETVFAKSTTNITVSSSTVTIFIVNDNNSWNDGTALADVSGGNESATTNSSGYLETKEIWSPSIIVGKYDIVVDVDMDGKYNSTTDFADSLTTTGFEVIPLPVPTLAVAKGSSNPSDHSWNLGNSSYNTMVQLKLTVGPIEDVKINSIGLSASGTGNDKDGVQAALLVLDDGNGVYDQADTLLAYSQFIKDNGILILNIQNGYTIPINQTAYMIIVYKMTNSSSNGDTYSFQVAPISAAGANTGTIVAPTGLPISSAIKTVVAATTTTIAASTTTSLSTTSTTVSTTTTIESTTTTIPTLSLGENWVYIVLLVGLIPILVIIIVIVILFMKKRRMHQNKFEELKEKWKKY
jgi:hypothetical protein